MPRVKETRKTTVWNEWPSVLQKSLTEPAWLEMSCNPTTRPLRSPIRASQEQAAAAVALPRSGGRRAESRQEPDSGYAWTKPPQQRTLCVVKLILRRVLQF
jgi:hypothetical protein